MNDWSSPWEEHCDFEAGAEDMELRAMRLEAERDAAMEAAMAEADALDELRAEMDTVEGPLAPLMPPPVDAPVWGDDDILF